MQMDPPALQTPLGTLGHLVRISIFFAFLLRLRRPVLRMDQYRISPTATPYQVARITVHLSAAKLDACRLECRLQFSLSVEHA
jgi:hypothetical protein